MITMIQRGVLGLVLLTSIGYWPYLSPMQTEYKYFILAVLGLIGCLTSFLRAPEHLRLDRRDLILLSPSLLCWLSMLWSRDPGLAFDTGMNWLLFYAVFRCFQPFCRHACKEQAVVLDMVQYVFVLNSLLLGYYVFAEHFLHLDGVQSRLRLNHNYVASLYVLLLPLFFYQVYRKQQMVLGVMTTLLGGFALGLMNSQVCKVIFMLEVGMFLGLLWSKNKTKTDILKIAGGLTTLFVVSAGLLAYFDIGDIRHELNSLSLYVDNGLQLNRVKLIERTWQLMIDESYLGAGAGNWIYDICRYGLNDYSSLKSYLTWRLYDHPHNLAMLFIGELGIFGILLVAGTLYSTYRHIAKHADPSMRWMCASVLICYLLISSIYGVSHFLLDHFAGHLVVVALAYGMIGHHTKRIRAPYLFVVLNVVVVIWFFYETALHHSYNKATSSEQRVALLEKWTHPILKSHIKKKSVQLCLIEEKDQDDTTLPTHYDLLVRSAPYAPRHLAKRAAYHYHLNEYEQARAFAMASNDIQSDVAPNMLLLARTACQLRNHDELTTYLDFAHRLQKNYDLHDRKNLSPLLKRRQNQKQKYLGGFKKLEKNKANCR